jgi:hypothetical protein
VWAAIFVWELARPPIWMLVVFLVTAVGAHGIKTFPLGPWSASPPHPDHRAG